MKASSQVDGANDEMVQKKKKKSKIVTISLQLDGTGPPVDENSISNELSICLDGR